MLYGDLHNHSTFSDGSFTPEEIALRAKHYGYKAVVLTDHDTVQGTYFMQKAARKEGLLTLLGVEFSTISTLGDEFHLLGYDFNPDEKEIKRILQHSSRLERSRVELLLNRAHKNGQLMEVTWKEVEDSYPNNDYLCCNQLIWVMRKKGLLKTPEEKENFRIWMRHTPQNDQFVEENIDIQKPDVADVIRAIRNAGGVPIIAHPHGQLKYINPLIEYGMLGVEVNFSCSTQEERQYLSRVAKEKNLYMTGGSDHEGYLSECYPVDAPEKYRHSYPAECLGTDEENFMKLYHRTMG